MKSVVITNADYIRHVRLVPRISPLTGGDSFRYIEYKVREKRLRSSPQIILLSYYRQTYFTFRSEAIFQLRVADISSQCSKTA